MHRHRAVYRFCKATLGGIIQNIYGFHPEKAQLGKGPYLITANHNGDLDPALVAMSFPDHMYFVASEHIFRKGFASWLLKYLFAPISRVKGMTDATAALNIIRAIKKNTNVFLFAEGNRSYNGVTGPIFPATGKLAKATGASLVTYRMEGGYLTTPRWSHGTRKGHMRGYVVNIYTPEQLKQMTPEEVNDRIREDIMEDAFDRQRTMPYRYKGKDRTRCISAPNAAETERSRARRISFPALADSGCASAKPDFLKRLSRVTRSCRLRPFVTGTSGRTSGLWNMPHRWGRMKSPIPTRMSSSSA